MSQGMLEQLYALDPAVLTEVARQALRDPALELLDWLVAPLSHEKIIETTGGLYRVSGHGRANGATVPWSVVIKVVNQVSDGECAPPDGWCYWKREMLAFQSGMLAGLPGPARAPRCYGVTERDGGGWIWLEHIAESGLRHWSLEDFGRAAHRLGQSAGVYLTGTPAPDHPWLSQPFFRSIYGEGGWWATHMATDTPESIWPSPIVQEAFPADLRARVLAVWRDKVRFFDALDCLPQVLCHNDCHRRNLMWSTGEDGQEELIVLDWAFCGPGGVGMDIGELVATSSYFFDSDPVKIAELERVAFDGYLAGLRAAGWDGDARLVRLGYAICATLWMGASLPGWAAIMLPPESGVNVEAMYGHPVGEVLAGWVALTAYLMDRADEAQMLIGELQMLDELR